MNNPTSEDNTSNAEILYEVEEKRDEYTKVYKKSDGTCTAIMTEEPLHYLNDGVWEEINNSMSLNGSLYTNLDNLFNVEFPESIDSNENLTVEKDGYELSFSVDNIEESSAVVENDIVVSDTNIPVADEAIAQTQSSVTYNDVAEDTDLQYIVTPNSIKENIIVSNKESVKDTYTFTFEPNGLDAEKLDDGSVIFKDENNEIKFRIPRPVMTDTNFAFSYDINVYLIENADGTISLEYSPSCDWTSSSDRVYPITIDPAIVIENKEVSWVEDTYVMYDSSRNEMQNTNFCNDYVGGAIDFTHTDDDGNEQYVNAEIYTKFNVDALKSLGENIVFTEVQYLFIGASADGKALAKKIATPIDLTTVTYATKPSLEDEVIDYHTSIYSLEDDNIDFSYIHFNITKPLNEWFNGAENNGFAVTPGNEGYYGLYYLNGVQTTTSSSGTTTKTYTTAIFMDYVEVCGYNENHNYHSQSVGRAGTGYVNDFTQTVSVLRDDLSIDGNIMPVTIGMIYNSATYDKIKSLNYNTLMAYGNGWTPNYLRAFVRMSDNNQLIYYTENGSAIDYTYTIENDVVTFEETYSDIYGEHGYEIEYIAATDNEAEHIVITHPDGYEERFNNMGLLASVTNPDYPSQKINIMYDSMYRIDYITDGVGRKYDYVYDDTTNLLSKVKCYAADGTSITAGSTTSPLEVNYTYDENKNLTSVMFPDGKSATYTYDANGNITSIANIDGYRIVYDYDTNGKVTKVTEQALDGTNYVNGNFITYDRLSPTQIKLTDGNGNYEVYQFNNNGTLLYTTDRFGNYTLNNDVGSNNNTYFISSNDYRTNAENLLLNASFEDSDTLTSRAKHWENSSTAFERTTSDNAYFGDYVYTASKTSNTTVYQKQTVEVLSGGEYTFSAYVKSDETNSGKLYLNISSYNSSNSKTETESIPVESTGGEWQRYSVTLDAPSNTKKIVVEFGFKSSQGTFYVDNVQLEQASSANEYNYIENGGFRESFEGWEDEPTYSIVDTEINDSNEKAVLFNGNTDGESQIHQIVKIDGKKDDVFTIGGWLKGLFVNSSTNNAWILNNINETTNTNV
ncbi:MAG: carbohydrate binding domain-containing protein, partial [Clostridia bacterium]|nr:carbohydrate binding domain-containing protein [Clostridia bacterium]